MFAANQYLLKTLLISSALLLSACATTGDGSPAQKRSEVQKMRQNVLSEVYEIRPHVRDQVRTAPGYAVFSNANINLLVASFGGGYGVVRNNRNGKDTYMNMGEVGVGLGAGVKDFRIVMIFHTDEALQYFVDKGWAFGAQADAAAKADDKGGAVGGETLVNNVTIHQLTKSGLALQATLKGTKFWKDREMNNF